MVTRVWMLSSESRCQDVIALYDNSTKAFELRASAKAS